MLDVTKFFIWHWLKGSLKKKFGSPSSLGFRMFKVTRILTVHQSYYVVYGYHRVNIFWKFWYSYHCRLSKILQLF